MTRKSSQQQQQQSTQQQEPAAYGWNERPQMPSDKVADRRAALAGLLSNPQIVKSLADLTPEYMLQITRAAGETGNRMGL